MEVRNIIFGVYSRSIKLLNCQEGHLNNMFIVKLKIDYFSTPSRIYTRTHPVISFGKAKWKETNLFFFLNTPFRPINYLLLNFTC